jgi:hypothetical protein
MKEEQTELTICMEAQKCGLSDHLIRRDMWALETRVVAQQARGRVRVGKFSYIHQ